MEMKSKYLKKFQHLTPKDLPISGSKILIELLPQPDLKSAGGLYLASGLKDNLQAPTLGIVLACGVGYWDEESETFVDLDQKPGNVVLVPDFAIRGYSSFPGLKGYAGGDIALAKESDVIVSWESVEAFEAYANKLNGGV